MYFPNSASNLSFIDPNIKPKSNIGHKKWKKKYDIFFDELVTKYIKSLLKLKKKMFDLKTLLTNSKDKESRYSNKVFFVWFVRNGTRMLTLSTFHLNAIFSSSAILSFVDVND